MRLWSIHPSYLDAKGLVALWRETLLAQKVLMGETRGYTNHPQLIRFRDCGLPLGAIAGYLRSIHSEAERRGYSFDKSKINDETFSGTIDVTDSQIRFEREHLLNKLKTRDPERYQQFRKYENFDLHPLFRKIPGEIEVWEKGFGKK